MPKSSCSFSPPLGQECPEFALICVSACVPNTEKFPQNARKWLLWGNTADGQRHQSRGLWHSAVKPLWEWVPESSVHPGPPGGLCSSWEMSSSGSVSHSQAGNCRYQWALCGSPHLQVRNLPLQLLKYLTQMRTAGWFGLPKSPLVNAAGRILNNNNFLLVVLIPPGIFFASF